MGAGQPNRCPTGCEGEGSGGPPGRQHRWDLWIVDHWLAFLFRLRGVQRVRVPPSGRAVPTGLLLERYVAAPGCADRRSLGACSGPGSGEFSGGNRDGLGGAAGTPAAPCLEVGCFTLTTISLLRPPFVGGAAGPFRGSAPGSYLVDSASSHMLVSKIKPCMSKYKHSCTVKLRMAH